MRGTWFAGEMPSTSSAVLYAGGKSVRSAYSEGRRSEINRIVTVYGTTD
jgi:hypothetical protein